MTEETEEFGGYAAEQQTEVRPSAGEVLTEARERLGLSVAEVARQLRLAPRQVEALEADDPASLPGKTFLRGFLRNYAKLLQLDPEPLLALCQPEPPQAQTIAVPTSRIEFGGKRRLMPFGDHSGKPWAKYAAIIGVAVLVLSWGMVELLQRQPSPQDIPLKSAGEATMVLSLPQAEAPVQAAPVTNQAAEPAPATAPVAAPVAPATAEALVTSAPPVAEVSGRLLQFVFDGDAWVEVKDKNGKVIFYQLNPKGSQQSVRGNPPFSLVIGNAAHVRLTYNDKPVDLAPHIKVDVARLTIE